MESKEVLTRTVDHLKKDVQYLIDRQKDVHSTDKELHAKLNEEKKAKMKELNNYTSRLKAAVAQQRKEAQKQKQANIVARAVDTLDYHTAKKTKSQEVMEKARNAKVSREQARQQYAEYTKYESEYLKHDPEDVPGLLFLSEAVLDKYGICPHIRINITYDESVDASLKTITRDRRKDWLDKQDDKGRTYYELYDKIILQQELIELKSQLEKCSSTIESFIVSSLNDIQFQLWSECCEFAEEYVKCSIKTKRLKERFKTLIHKLSVIKAETTLSVHEYLSSKLDYNFVVNTLPHKSTESDKIHQVIYREQFDEMLRDFITKKEAVDQKAKYVNNMMRNFKNNMYMFLTDQKTFSTTQMLRGTKSVSQAGKYYKRWTALTQEEKDERFYAFSDYHIEKHLVQSNIMPKEEKPAQVAKLAELLKNAYATKHIIYRDFSWVTKRGIIENVKLLRYDKDKQEFFLAKTFRKVPETDDNDNVKKSKKKVSQQTIFSRDNENKINESVLLYIVQKFGNGDVPSMDKADKEKCIEIIKDKLKVKKITASDKVIISKKFDEIFEVVKANKSEKEC